MGSSRVERIGEIGLTRELRFEILLLGLRKGEGVHGEKVGRAGRPLRVWKDGVLRETSRVGSGIEGSHPPDDLSSGFRSPL